MVEYTDIILTLILVVVGGCLFIFGKMGVAKGWFKNDDAISTIDFIDKILDAIKPALSLLTEDNVIATKLIIAFEGVIDYALELLETGELDKLELLRFAYLQAENAGLELDIKEKKIIESVVATIFLFIQ